MRFTRILATGVTVAAMAGTVVFAAAHNTPEAMAAKARQSHMELYQFNANTLFSFAKGDVEFDVDASQAAANNLVALSQLSQRGYWLPGSSSDDIENTRALPAIWAEGSDVGDKGKAAVEAIAAMATAAGTLDGVRASIGALGGACTACHKAYRAPE